MTAANLDDEPAAVKRATEAREGGMMAEGEAAEAEVALVEEATMVEAVAAAQAEWATRQDQLAAEQAATKAEMQRQATAGTFAVEAARLAAEAEDLAAEEAELAAAHLSVKADRRQKLGLPADSTDGQCQEQETQLAAGKAAAEAQAAAKANAQAEAAAAARAADDAAQAAEAVAKAHETAAVDSVTAWHGSSGLLDNAGTAEVSA